MRTVCSIAIMGMVVNVAFADYRVVDADGWTTTSHTPQQLCVHIAAPATKWNPNNKGVIIVKVHENSIIPGTLEACTNYHTLSQARCLNRVNAWHGNDRHAMNPDEIMSSGCLNM
jgi:hypothetical protein